MAEQKDNAVVVIGLGRFGTALALELVEREVEVLGIDSNPRIVQGLAGSLTHVVAADSTELEVLQQLGVDEFRRAVVGIGTDMEASILTTSLLTDLGVPDIWAKAINRQHARILHRIGAHHVVQPEHDTGKRVAHLVTGRMLDYIEFEDGFALVKTAAPTWAEGRSLAESQIRSRYGVTVVCVKRRGEDFTYATADTVINPDDLLIVAGKSGKAERFANLT
ncbi:potassium transporter [Longimycelium tulufanense]|uniref:Potassium transporter n=1 Tax=Longimycelium tulufanense TaxID=907463 RepID=A0A8J3CES7_9PSEU|nr:TrkA family potassium uptake protein [Longimycelium tulufanense]GGM55021.1 potassium transporter [Longimycelium tulufanense]